MKYCSAIKKNRKLLIHETQRKLKIIILKVSRPPSPKKHQNIIYDSIYIDIQKIKLIVVESKSGVARDRIRGKQEGRITKGHDEAYGGDYYVHYVNYSIVSQLKTYQSIAIVHCKYMQFIACQLYRNKGLKKIVKVITQQVHSSEAQRYNQMIKLSGPGTITM